MSWQVASFVLIGLVLAGGAVWYERSRPPARLVGLVAALAAVAVAGRVALAPLPNVVATTDIALLTGFSLGAAPGFAVGALAGLVSNVWLGQGPWTPWQMAGWGLVGIGGAMLARVTLHRAGRATLAVAAGIAGLAYGALLDLSVMVTYGGEQSLDRYLALSARGIPFNVAHALGNLAIIWAAGPAIVRMLERFRVRSSFVWHPSDPRTSRKDPYASPSGTFGVAGLLFALAVAAPVALAGSASDAASWLQQQQNNDGGWGNAAGARSSPAMTAWAMLGIEATGDHPDGAVAYLRKRSHQVKSATDLERTILALEGAGADPRAFSGRNLVAELVKQRSRDGSWKGGVNPTAFGILALEAAGDGAQLRRSVSWIETAQNGDGGWGFNRGVASDPDSTGAALQALAAAGAGGTVLSDGVRYLRAAQRGDGGFPAQAGLTSNSQSTAWAIQGLVAAGVDPGRVRKRDASPIDFLRRRQAGDGHVAYSRQSDQTPVWVTAQAVMGLEEVALPIASVERQRKSATSEPEPEEASSGSGAKAAKGKGAADPKARAKPKRSSPIKPRPKPSRRAKKEADLDGAARRGRVVTGAGEPGAATTIGVGEPDEGEDDEGGGLPAIAWAGIVAAAIAAAGTAFYRRRTG